MSRYFWPETAILFYVKESEIEAAFGFIEKRDLIIEQRRTFELDKKEQLAKWVHEISQTYPKTYVASVLDTINQGALPGCKKDDLANFGIDMALVHSLCIEKKWMVYTSIVEVQWFEKKFKDISLDFLFSPFVLLYTRAKPEFSDKPKLFLLHHHGIVFVAVWSKQKLWYADLLILASKPEDDEDAITVEEENDDDLGLSFDLDDLDDIEEGVEKISELDTLGEFKDEIKPSGDAKENNDEEAALELLEYDLNMFDQMKDTIERYYHDDRYKHEFIEKVMIFDMGGLGKDIVRYIEDELFMEASLLMFDPIDAMGRLITKELGV